MSLDTDIRTALETPLFAVTGFPDSDHRALENADYEPIINEAWARVTHFWGREWLGSLPAAGGTLWRSGILSIGLFFPLLNGPADSDTLAQAVRDALRAGKPLSVGGRALEVRENRRGQGRRDPGGKWWHVPIDVEWRLRALNPLT
jgi:hypothetical protein